MNANEHFKLKRSWTWKHLIAVGLNIRVPVQLTEFDDFNQWAAVLQTSKRAGDHINIRPFFVHKYIF